jgi:putative tryptophan/tyrosine transport system substrate-binding protein
LRRRDFITLLGGAAVAWPLAARAQQRALPVVGILARASAWEYSFLAAALRGGLSEGGFVEGRNVLIEYRWAEGHYERLPPMAADLARRQVAVIVTGSTPAAVAAKAATNTIPIVSILATDPVAVGLVASLSRPGGNLTGVANLGVEVGPKMLELLHEAVPNASVIALLVNPNNPAIAEIASRGIGAAAQRLGLQAHTMSVGIERDLDAAFGLRQAGAGALIIVPDPLFNSQSQRIAELTNKFAIPAIMQFREFAVGGGLMSYADNLAESYFYAARILKGESPSDLPFQEATSVELVVNLKAAKALGITMPLALLGRADEVIE